MASFAYRGIPIKDEYGNIVAVQPVKAIQASDGLWYPGVLSQDAEGNAFTYNQVPSNYVFEAICFLLVNASTNMFLMNLTTGMLVCRQKEV